VSPLRYIVILVTLLAVAAISFAIPSFLGRGAEWLDVRITSPDGSDPLEDLQDGYRRERSGDLLGALGKYRAAAKSKLALVNDAATRATNRVNRKLNTLGTFYGSLRTLQEWTVGVRVPLLLTAASIAGYWVVSGLRRRRGTEIGRFSVIPEYEADFAIRFDRLLLEEIARAALAYRSDQLQRIDAAVTISDSKADDELDNLVPRATAAIRQGEIKSVIGFWLAELVRRFWSVRPEYVLSGTVIIQPDQATAYAQLARPDRSSAPSVLEASSVEAAAIKSSAPLSRSAQAAAPVTAFEGGDQRQDAQRLSDLASVLASKYCVRWMEESTMAWWPPEIRPASWTTVYRFVRSQEQEGAERKIAIKHLERTLEQDPLYRPATFFLGYARFLEGETERAQQLFSSLTRPFNEQADLRVQGGLDKWTQQRLSWIIRHKGVRSALFPWIDPMDRWHVAHRHVNSRRHSLPDEGSLGKN
jgi:hypothetical protein